MPIKEALASAITASGVVSRAKWASGTKKQAS
jgi:hypothetical protein